MRAHIIATLLILLEWDLAFLGWNIKTMSRQDCLVGISPSGVYLVSVQLPPVSVESLKQTSWVGCQTARYVMVCSHVFSFRIFCAESKWFIVVPMWFPNLLNLYFLGKGVSTFCCGIRKGPTQIQQDLGDNHSEETRVWSSLVTWFGVSPKRESDEWWFDR